MPKYLPLVLVPALALGSLVLTGCGETEVRIGDPSAQKELTGKWSAQNSKKVAAEMIQSSLTKPWCSKFQKDNKRNPKVQLAKVIVRDTSGETIVTDPFMKAIRQEFVNSGNVDVLDEDTKTTREVGADQAAFADKGKELAKEDAADFVLKGTIATITDQEGRRSTKYYQVSMELTDVQTRRIVWTETTEIGKEIEQSRWK